MSFLDKINAAKNPSVQAEKKVNPLVKTTPITTSVPITKVNPLLATKLPPFTATSKDESKKSFISSFKKPALPIVETKEESSELSVSESHIVSSDTSFVNVESNIESVSTEETVNKTPIIEEIANESPVVEEKKTTSKRSGSRSTKKTTSTVDKAKEVCLPPDTGIIEDSYPTTTISFTEAATALNSPFEDVDWVTFKDEIEKELNSIVINQDMNPGVLKVTLSELNIVYDKIAQPLHESKTLFDNLTNKEDGIIAVIKNISLGSGNNDMERKKAGFLAAMNYKPRSNDGNINLFETAAEVRSRYNFLKSVYDRLKYKSDMLITMNGALKLESEFIRRGDN